MALNAMLRQNPAYSGPTVSAASASVLSYGTALGGICDEPHTNRITWTISGTCSGHTVRLYSSDDGEFATGLSCSGSPYDHAIEGFTSSAGTGGSRTYEVRLYDGSSNLVSSKTCAIVQWQNDGSCVL